MTRFFLITLLFFASFTSARAEDMQALLQKEQKTIEKLSRKTIEPALERLIASGNPGLAIFLEKLRAKDVYMRSHDKLFFSLKSRTPKPSPLSILKPEKKSAWRIRAR